jgi:hypothetical protein
MESIPQIMGRVSVKRSRDVFPLRRSCFIISGLKKKEDYTGVVQIRLREPDKIKNN